MLQLNADSKNRIEYIVDFIGSSYATNKFYEAIENVKFKL